MNGRVSEDVNETEKKTKKRKASSQQIEDIPEKKQEKAKKSLPFEGYLLYEFYGAKVLISLDDLSLTVRELAKKNAKPVSQHAKIWKIVPLRRHPRESEEEADENEDEDEDPAVTDRRTICSALDQLVKARKVFAPAGGRKTQTFWIYNK